MILILTALALGFLHGLGADHLMAIAALSMGTADDGQASQALRRARAFAVAVRFAIGHALLLALGAGAILALGWSLPLVVERTGEILGGALLVVMGGAGLWGIAAGRVYRHSHVPTLVGAAFAVSSLRALTMLAPFAGGEGLAANALQDPVSIGAAPLPMLLLLIAVFGGGILLSMSLFGVAFARLMSATAIARLGHGAAAVMSCASITLGIFWIATA